MSERRDEITSENARPLAQRIAQTLDLAFADHDVQVTIDGHDVLLEIPCPSAAVDHGLWIRWEGPEHDVIVGFHTQHAHFGPWEEYSDQWARIDAILAALDEGIATARAFLAERMVVITWYSRGEVETATRDVPEHAQTEVREGAKEIFNLRSRVQMLLNGHWPRFGRVTATIRSWNGTHDADIDHVR